MPPSPRVAIGVDPGRAKCGLAVLDTEGALLHRSIVPADECATAAADLAARFTPAVIVLGDGTGSAAIRAEIEAAAPGVPIEVVEESHTSEEARRRRVAEERRGWRRLVPAGLLTPSTPYDDLVATILAERWLSSHTLRAHASASD